MENVIKTKESSKVLIEAREVSHQFDYELFSNINLTLLSHESIAIIGISGCGKSTFLNILSSLLIPNQGEVLYKSNSIYKYTQDQLLSIRRDHFGIIFQSHYLFRGFNANENLLISSLLSNQNIDKQLLKDFGIHNLMNHDIGQLSGGQQQRLSIARVLTKKPKIIFADEPTGNLDKKTANNVMEKLFDYIHKNKAGLIIVTHEESIAYQCDHIYKFNENQLEKIK